MAIQDLKLNLNDFRSVLGKENDGNIVFKRDASGIEKANYGNWFLNIFRTTRKAAANPVENRQVRTMLLSAIQNSSERKVLTPETMNRIYAALGMTANFDPEDFAKPLSRRELKIAIDIIDEATQKNALIKKNIDALKTADLYDKNVADGVMDAIKTSPLLKKSGNTEERLAKAWDVFGQDFRGRSPAEMDKFVRNNYAVIREQVFDRLYWSCPSLKDFEPENVEEVMNMRFEEGLFDEKANISPEAVKTAFREAVGDLMDRYATGKPVTTKLATLAPTVEEFAFLDKKTEDIWNKVLKGSDIETTVSRVLTAPAKASQEEDVHIAGVGMFNSLQLKRAAQAVNNLLRTTFNQLYAEKGYNTQETEKAFSKKMGSLVKVFEEIDTDLKTLGGEDAGQVRAKLADEIGKLVLSQSIAMRPGKLADAVRKALDNTVKSFSTRHIVEDFVNANFGYMADKSPVVNFFMEKIANIGQANGITNEQKAALTNYQKATLAGAGAAARQQIEISLLTPLSQAYNNMVAQSDPAKVREMRQTRNSAAFEKFLQSDSDYLKAQADYTKKVADYTKLANENKLTEDGKDPQKLIQDETNAFNRTKANTIARIKTDTLLAMVGIDKAAELGVTKDAGSFSIKTVWDKVRLEATGEDRNVEKPDPHALEVLDEQLLAMNDKDFEFFYQYSAKGMGRADTELASNSLVYNQKNCGNIFQDALRDGAFSVTSIPTKTVVVLKELVNAQIKATSAYEMSMNMRDLLPEGDKEAGSAMSVALARRFVERFAASGVQPVPSAFKAISPNENATEIGYRLNNLNNDKFMLVRGFGTTDLARILKLFNEMGISLAAFEGKDMNAQVDLLEKIMCLSTIAAMSTFKLDGLAEFTERVVGKPFSKVTFTDVLSALSKHGAIKTNQKKTSTFLMDNITITDPLSKLSGVERSIKELFAGETQLSNATLSPAETTELLAKVRELDAVMPGIAKTVNINLKGVDVQLTRLADGELSVKTGKTPYRSAFDANGITRMIENEITSKPNSFDAAVVKSALPSIEDVKSGKVQLVRARELYAKTAAAKTGTLPVMFSAYTTEKLREIALKAVDGQFTANDLPKEPPATYNSGAMIEMHAALSLTSAAEIDAKVKINVPEGKSIELRKTVPPDAQSVRNVIADLFLNKDTWEFDASIAGKAQPGERVRKLLVEHAPELAFILKGLDGNAGLDLLAFLPAETRDAAKSVLEDIKKIDIASLADTKNVTEETRHALAAIETKIDGTVNTLIDALQDKVTALFAPKANAGEAKASWQKTFAELNGKEGIDTSTKQGKFTMTVLQNYFKNSAQVDKRAMLSAFIRNTDENSTNAKQVAELLKGAGPLLQKMLQGLPLSSFNAETQLALKDMKSRLLPIPDEAVKAQMLELVRSSNGEIYSIDVKKSLGAASVGQAFLCTIKTKARPYIGEECVIKLLRPNVDTAIQREKALIDKLIANDPAMKATFDGQYRKILEEFDLTLESTNVGIGTTVYERPGGVATLHTMQMLEGTEPTMTSMIVKKAEGVTFDAKIDSLRNEANELLAPLKQTTVIDGKQKTVYKAASANESALIRRQLMMKAAQLEEQRNQILDVAKAWFENALFGNGFFHGDLHGGNLMTSSTGTTFIDFGNCSHLNKSEQDAIKMMLATTISGDTDNCIANFLKLMPADAQSAFNQAFPNDHNNKAARDELVAILKRGNSSDLMSRLQAFIATVQAKDVPIPSALQNFVQSYMRLNDIIIEIDRSSEDIKIAAASIYCDMPEIAPVENEPPLLAGIRKIAKVFIGNANEPYSEEEMASALNDVTTYLDSEAGRNEVHANTHNIEWALGTLQPFVAQMEKVTACNCRNDRFDSIFAEPTPEKTVKSARNALATLQSLQNEGKVPSADADKAFDDLEEYVRGMAQGMAEKFANQMRLIGVDGDPTFDTIPLKVDKSMNDICSDVMFANQDVLKSLARSEFGTVGVIPFAFKFSRNYNDGVAAAAHKKAIGPVLAEQNRKLPAEERLSGREMVTISRATDTFLVQSPRPDADAGWCTNEAKRRDFLTAIAYNISRAAEALNIGEGHPISATAVRHAVLNFGLADKTLITSVVSLSQEDYDQLLADANTIDQLSGKDVHVLATALAALRDAQTLLDKVVANSQNDDDE